MLSDETNLNERIGQRNKAQLNIRNPQIINGGQTAYTLSRIWEETTDASAAASLFEGKEVLLKVITLNSATGGTEEEKLKLIEAISIATNAQTAVQTADRYANEKIHTDLQRALFDRFGLLYERKRGEFADGVHKSYIDRSQTVERNLLLRVFLAANGHINASAERKAFAKFTQSWKMFPSDEELNRFYFGYLCYSSLEETKSPHYAKRSREVSAKVYAMTTMSIPTDVKDYQRAAKSGLGGFLNEWNAFLQAGPTFRPHYVRERIDKATMTLKISFDARKWFTTNAFEDDVKHYFQAKRVTP